MAGNANNVRINPVNVFWQIEGLDQWDFSAATAAGLGGTYVTMYLPTGAGFYAWFDENSTDVDPAPGGGLTAIAVAYGAGALPAAIATAFQTAVDGTAGFSATVSGTVVTVKRDAVGGCTDAAENTAAAYVDLTICRRGKDFDLGLLQGDIEPTFSPSTFTVVAHQSGPTPRASLMTGFEEISLETVLLETTKSKLKELYKIYGGAFTPGGGTEIFGAGSASLGKNMLIDAARLILKPVNAVSDEDNFNLALCVPVPSSMVFSGENPQVLNVTWTGYQDDTLDSRINAVSVGDIFQTGI